jgi:hypothetical protein
MTTPQSRTTPTKGPGRRFRDLATLLPILGVLLLATPIVSIFTQSGQIFGLPSPIFYIFGIWAGLIILAFALARRSNKANR